MNKPLLTLALTLSCTAAGAASPPATLPASVAACLRVTDASERLNCYDQAVAALLPAPANPSPAGNTVAATPARPAASAPAVPAPPATPATPKTTPPSPVAAATPPPAAPAAPAAAASFGQEQLSGKQRPPANPADLTLHATVTALATPLPDTYRVTLDNGQVWKQLDSSLGFSLKVGDAVTLGKGAMGSYRLWRDADGPKAWVRVTRLN